MVRKVLRGAKDATPPPPHKNHDDYEMIGKHCIKSVNIPPHPLQFLKMS